MQSKCVMLYKVFRGQVYALISKSGMFLLSLHLLKTILSHNRGWPTHHSAGLRDQTQ